ncbi:Flp family type IVb pilin [Halomonas salifodinae]|uniref:Flp family type IVb pilin n=1 Tax=Halomonas salifodinae TaxID=438745 RepID=UPI0033A1FABA
MNKLIEKSTELTQRGAVAMRLNRPIFRRQRGASAIEYVVIAALIAVAFFVIAGTVGEEITATLQKVVDALKGTETT